MGKENILKAITDVANNNIPKGAKVILFGSQARGDAHEGSDWDVLMLVDKNRVLPSDHSSAYCQKNVHHLVLHHVVNILF